MRVLLIDKYCGTGSTGKIACAIAEDYERQGHEAKVAYGRDNKVPERFRRLGVSKKFSAPVLICLIVFYCMLSGFSKSVIYAHLLQHTNTYA